MGGGHGGHGVDAGAGAYRWRVRRDACLLLAISKGSGTPSSARWVMAECRNWCGSVLGLQRRRFPPPGGNSVEPGLWWDRGPRPQVHGMPPGWSRTGTKVRWCVRR